MIRELSIVCVLFQILRAKLVHSSDFTNKLFTLNNGWDYIQASGAITECFDGLSQVSVYGALDFGQNTLIYKNFDLPPHYSITLDFNLWIIDFVQNYDYYIYVDNQVIETITGQQIIYSQNYCGNSELDGYQQFIFTVNHINSRATIIITSNLNQLASITSWGIRDFTLSFEPCPIQCIQCQDTTSICNDWQFEMEFWTNKLIIQSEGWNYIIGNFQQVSCLGQQFIQIYSIGDNLSNTVKLKPYYKVRIQFQLLKVGQYQNEEIQFLINQVMKYQQVFSNEQYYAYCNQILNDGDVIINVSIDALYSEFNSNLLTFQFQSNILSSNTFYGIRDFYVFIGPCIQNCLLCTSSTDCIQCDVDYIFDGIKCQSTAVSTPSIYQYYYTVENIKIFSDQSLTPPSWSYSTNLQTQCDTYTIFASDQQQQVFINLTSLLFHNQIIIKFLVVAIDNWNLNNLLQLQIDSQIYSLIRRNKYDSRNISNLCGDQIWNDNVYEITLVVSHYDDTLALQFYLSDPSIIQSYGITDVSIYYYYCGPKYQCSICDSSGLLCLACSDSTRAIANNCECPQGSTIQSKFCPNCNNKGPPTQVYCQQDNMCNQQTDNYVPYCVNQCTSGFTMDINANQCKKTTPPWMDGFPVIMLGQYYNTQTFTNSLSWIVVKDSNKNPISNPIGKCGQQSLLGGVGFQGIIYMDFNKMPPYRRIKIKYQMLLIDVSEEVGFLYSVWGYGTSLGQFNLIQKEKNICGGPEYDLIYPFEILMAHTGQLDYFIQISGSNMSALQTSYGVYDVTISYQPCADQIRCATCDDNGCLTCSVPERIQSPLCLCPTYEYLDYADCPTCPYKCQGNLCNLQGCTVCADSRRGEPPDCLCPTYEIYGISSCPLCQQYCLYCTENMCIECQPGYYPYGQYCYKCPYQCSTCLFNGCLTCSDPQRGPAPFCRCQSYEIINQKQCPTCQQNCQTCDQTGCLVCLTPRILPFCDCPLNFYEIDNVCIQCEVNCKTCNQFQCLSCYKNYLLLPYCICPQGYSNIMDGCEKVTQIVESYGYYNQQLTQIIIGFDHQFVPVALENSNVLIQENCVMIKNANGLCQIYGQSIIYQFDSSIYINLGDEILINPQYIGFLNFGLFIVNKIYVGLNQNIDYRPYFDINYPSQILTCREYLISVQNLIYVGNQDYQIQIISHGVQYKQEYNQIYITALLTGSLNIDIQVTNFIGFSLRKSIQIESNQDLQIDFEILPLLGQLNRFFNLIIQISQIVLHSCNVNFINTPITKIIEINFDDLYISQVVTQDQQLKFNIQVGSLNIEQIYKLNVTVTHKQYTKTQITNYTINQIKPFFSILGGNRMIYINNRLNVSAVIVDPDTKGLICSWECVTLNDRQDCGFNFTSQMYQILESYQLELYRSYLFSYNCLGIEVQAIYHIVDINEDQLFMFFPAFYSTYELNKLYPVEYIIFNETKNNLLKPIILNSINIKAIQNFSLVFQEIQINSYGFQNLLNFDGSMIIQAQINSMISSINITLKNLTMTVQINILPQTGICSEVQFKTNYNNFDRVNNPYLFRYMAQINDKNTMLLSDWSIYESQQFYLPQGLQQKNYSYIIIGQVIDKFGYLYNITGSVYVLPNQNKNLIYQLLQEFQADSYYEKMLYLGYQYLQIQQNGCETNCSGNGICTNQLCICQDQYYLLDCSANITQQTDLKVQIDKLLYDLINNDIVDNTLITLLLNLINYHYVQQQMNQDFIIILIEYVVYNIQVLINEQQIYQNNIDTFIQILINPQSYLNQLKLEQQLMNLIQIVDKSLVIIQNNHQLSNQTIQNDLSLKLISVAKLYTYYQGTQLHIDQTPYQLKMTNLEILAYRCSSNYSQIFFNQPILMQNQINFLDDQKIIQLQNDSIISHIIFNINPYVFDDNYPYKTQQNQVAAVQVYDQNGTQYRSFQPFTTQLKLDSSIKSSNKVCIGQQNGKWISKICQTIKITNSNVTSCQCDTLDQQSVVDDVNNLYTNSKIYTLQNYRSVFKFQFEISILAYLLLFFGMCSIIFGFMGYKLDLNDYNQQNSAQTETKDQKQEKDQNQLELNYDSEEEAILIRYDLMRAKHRDLQKEILVGIKKLHPFIRIYNEFLIEQPRPARYIIFFLKQCILLSITSIFGKGFSLVQNIFIGIISMIFITPLEKLLMQGFNQKVSKKIQVALILFLLIIYLSCWYICIAVSVTVNIYESNQWSLIFFISLIINQVIVEGFTIIMKIVLAPYLSSILFKGGFIARIIYLYFYDIYALKIVKDLNMLNTIQF